MSLKLQIISFIYSFLYGIFFSFFLDLSTNIIYNEKKYIKVLGTLFIIIFNSFLYFIILMKINNGIIHIYLFFSIILGILFKKNMIKNIKLFDNIFKK